MNTTPDLEQNRKLRWYQYRLWHLFALMVVAAIACSWFACKMREAERQREVVEMVQRLGGSVRYDYQFDADGKYLPKAQPPGPAWFRDLVGIDLIADVVEVNLWYTSVKDADLAMLSRLSELKKLALIHAHTTDEGLKHLHGLSKLKEFGYSHHPVTNKGIEDLQRALPNCKIWQYAGSDWYDDIFDTGGFG